MVLESKEMSPEQKAVNLVPCIPEINTGIAPGTSRMAAGTVRLRKVFTREQISEQLYFTH